MTIETKSIDYFVGLYRSLGCNVFQIQSNSKRPIDKWEIHQKEKNTKLIHTGNIAVVCGVISSNLIVIDLDSFELSTKVFQKWNDLLTKTLVVKTGRGYHIYLRCEKLPDGRKIDGPNDWHVDVKSEGGFVVGAGSIHPDTKKPYQIVSKTAKILQIPNIDDLMVQLRKLGFDTNEKSLAISRIKKGIKKGLRNDAAFKLACYELHRNRNQDKVWNYLLNEWNKLNNPPMDEKELQVCFDSACKNVPPEERGKQAKIEHGVLADEVQADFEFRTLEDTKEILCYVNGVYKLGGEAIIEKECEIRAGQDCNQNLVNEVIHQIQRRTYTPRNRFDTNLDLISLSNGILNLKTMKFLEPSPKYLHRVLIPVTYDTKARCPKFLKFIRECLPDPEDIITVIEEFANILLRANINFEKSSIYIGRGQNGKSTYLKLIGNVIGYENTANVSIHDLNERTFALAQLDGKLANIHTDISNEELTSLGKFKILVSGDPINAEHKNQPMFSMASFAKHFFSANEMPDIKDNSDAVYRRILITEWEKQFIGKERNTNLFNELTTEKEKSGILNILIENQHTLIRNNGFRYEQSIEYVRNKIRIEADKETEFCKSCLIEDITKKTPKDLTYRIYVKWCQINKVRPKSRVAFNNKLMERVSTEATAARIDGKTTKVWLGIGLNFDNTVVQEVTKEKEGLFT